MIDVEFAVYDRIAKLYDEKFPSGSCYSEPTESPASFPCMTLWESDNATLSSTLDGSELEHHAAITYDLNVYSNKVSGAKIECKSIVALLDEEMQKLGFQRIFCNQTKNQDPRIYRMTARYRGYVSEDYRIYKKS